MMFEGSAKVGEGEHYMLAFNHGGNMNGTINSGRCGYYETLAKNQLALALFLEADRMRSPDVTQAKLDHQRNAGQEKRRLNVDNRPYGKGFLEIDNLAYDNFAYKHSTIREMSDLNAATLADVKDFFRIYYAPNNAVLTLVGDLDTQEALAKVEKYFGSIPSQPPPPVDMTEPAHYGERSETIEGPLARTPLVMLSHRNPPGDTPENYPFQVLDCVMGRGESSRLYGEQVKNKQCSASGLAASSDRLLELASDMVLNPTFPGDEPASYQKRQLADLERARSEPEFLADERFHQALYRDFVAAVASATPKSINAASSARLKEFHDRDYAPSNTILGAVGDFKADEMLALITKYFGAWPDHSVNASKLGELSPPAPKTIYLVDRPGSMQTNILLGDYGARRTDPDYIPLVVMNRIVGGGPAARIFTNLREVHGYTYAAYSEVGDDIYREAWQANTEVRTPVTDGSMHELMRELNRIRDKKVPDQELEEARNAIVAGFALSLENPGHLLSYAVLVDYYGLPENYWNQYPAKVAQVDAGAVEAAVKKYVDHLQIVCVGDARQTKDVLATYSPVEVSDAKGKRPD